MNFKKITNVFALVKMKNATIFIPELCGQLVARFCLEKDRLFSDASYRVVNFSSTVKGAPKRKKPGGLKANSFLINSNTSTSSFFKKPVNDSYFMQPNCQN